MYQNDAPRTADVVFVVEQRECLLGRYGLEDLPGLNRQVAAGEGDPGQQVRPRRIRRGRRIQGEEGREKNCAFQGYQF